MACPPKSSLTWTRREGADRLARGEVSNGLLIGVLIALSVEGLTLAMAVALCRMGRDDFRSDL